MIKANFNAYGSYITDSVTQWDINRELAVTGLNISVAPEVHFFNADMRAAIVRQASLTDHVVTVKIPNSLLQIPLTIKADIGVYEGTVFKTLERVEIPVRPAIKPEDYSISDDEEIYSFNRLENELANKATNARVDNIIAHNNDTDGNTELLDIRTGFDDTLYPTAGRAVREQIGNITQKADNELYSRVWKNGTVDIYHKKGLLGSNGVWIASETYESCYTEKIPCNEGEQFYYYGNGRGDAVSYIFFYGNDVISYGRINVDEAYCGSAIITIPAGVNYVMFASLKTANDFSLIVIPMSDKTVIPRLEYTENSLDYLLKKIDYTEINGYLDIGGYVTTSSNYHGLITEKLLCKPGDIFRYTGVGRSSTASCIFYFNNDIVDYLQINENNQATTALITIPTGVNYVIFSSFADITSDVVFDIEAVSYEPLAVSKLKQQLEELKNSSFGKGVLWGKKWVACGDSFTSGGSVEDNNVFNDGGLFNGEYKVYPFWIGRRNNMTVINEAISGSTMTHIDGRTDAFSDTRYKNIAADADYITLCFGINDDTGHLNANIGTIDDTDNTTFYGAWNVVLEYLITNHPWSKIGIIISNGMQTDSSYPEAIRNVAKKWGIPYLDIDNDEQVPLMHRTNKTYVCEKARELRQAQFIVSEDDHHPSVKAHEYESTFIENWLKTL